MKEFLRNLSKNCDLKWRLPRMCLMFALCVTGCALLFENRLIYHPTRYPGGYYEYAEAAPEKGVVYPKIEDWWFTTADGKRLHGWYASPHRLDDDGREVAVESRGVLLWLHGNAGNVTHRYQRLWRFMSLPADVFIFDYRGFGRSEGRPNEEGLYRDADAAWRYLTEERQIDRGRIVLYGVSLGAAPAIELATRVQPVGLITEAAFTSIPDMGRIALPIVPRFLVRTQMNSLEKIPGINCPKLLIHGTSDEVIPFRMGPRLFEAAGEPKEFYEVPGAMHDDVDVVGGATYMGRIRTFLDTVVVPAE